MISEVLLCFVKLWQFTKMNSEKLKIAQITVHLWISLSKSKECSTTPSPKKGSGRPRKTNKLTDKLLKCEVLANPTITAKEIKSNYHNLLSDVSEWTSNSSPKRTRITILAY